LYYNPHELLSYNCLFNFVIGNRGAGKTWSSKKWAIKSFLKTGAQFIYLRRYKTEFKDIKVFFADIMDEFPDTEFEVKGMNFYIDKKLAGYGVALSTALTKKSTPFPNVDKIIFDEFVIDSKVIHYLSNEVTAFLEFYETVARLREGVKVLFLSNAVSIVNPYFLYWNMQPNGKKRFTRYGHILVEFVKNQEFIDAKYKTKFGQIIQGTKYAEYAIENQYLKDNDHFVEKKTGTSRFEFSIIYNGHTYGFWNDYSAGAVFVSDDVDPYSKLQFVLTDADHKPNMMLVKNANRSFLLKSFMKAYEGGWMRFESMTIKNQCIEIFRLLKGGGR
jgi:hypothetical protein